MVTHYLICTSSHHINKPTLKPFCWTRSSWLSYSSLSGGSVFHSFGVPYWELTALDNKACVQWANISISRFTVSSTHCSTDVLTNVFMLRRCSLTLTSLSMSRCCTLQAANCQNTLVNSRLQQKVHWSGELAQGHLNEAQVNHWEHSIFTF